MEFKEKQFTINFFKAVRIGTEPYGAPITNSRFLLKVSCVLGIGWAVLICIFINLWDEFTND